MDIDNEIKSLLQERGDMKIVDIALALGKYHLRGYTTAVPGVRKSRKLIQPSKSVVRAVRNLEDSGRVCVDRTFKSPVVKLLES